MDGRWRRSQTYDSSPPCTPPWRFWSELKVWTFSVGVIIDQAKLWKWKCTEYLLSLSSVSYFLDGLKSSSSPVHKFCYLWEMKSTSSFILSLSRLVKSASSYSAVSSLCASAVPAWRCNQRVNMKEGYFEHFSWVIFIESTILGTFRSALSHFWSSFSHPRLGGVIRG